MTTTPTLDSVASAFSHWRNTRAYRREAVPIALQEQALGLLKEYRTSQVTTTLKINHGMIKRWRIARATEAGFVELPPVATPQVTSSTRFTISNAQGHQMHISGMSSDQLACLIHRFCAQPGGES